MPTAGMAEMQKLTSPTPLTHMTHLHPILKKQKMSQGLLGKNNHSIGCDLAVSMAIQAFLHCDTFRKWKFPLVS